MLKANLKNKLIVIFLLVAIVPVLVVGLLAYNRSGEQVEAQASSTLEMFARLAGSDLESYFAEREIGIEVLATSRDIYESLNILQGVEWNLQDPNWQERTEETLDTILPYYIEKHGYYMGFLTGPDGVLVYSTDDDISTNTDLSDRDYIQTALAGELNWSDLFYSEVAEENVMVLSYPVRNQGLEGEVLGTLNILFYDQDITGIVHEGLDQLGRTGDAYLIDTNGLLLTNTLQGEYASNAVLNESIDTEASELLSRPIRQGDTSFFASGKYLNYDNEDVFGQLQVTRLGDEIVGLVVEIQEDEILAGIGDMRNTIFLIIGLVGILIGVIAYFIAGGIASPIVSATSFASKVAKGDLTSKIEDKFLKRKDEIGTLSKALDSMRQDLKETIGSIVSIADNLSANSEELSASSEEIAASSQQVSSAIQEVATGSEEQSAQVEDTQNAINELSGEIKTVASKNGEMRKQAKVVSGELVRSSETITTTTEQIQGVHSNQMKMAESITGLTVLSDKIGKIVDMISDISQQTNLLALNAAIEAARAGEAGRGFSVVADEIRGLAEESSQATEEIDGLIKEIQDSVAITTRKMEDTNAVVNESVTAIGTTRTRFSEIEGAVEMLNELIEIIVDSTEEMSLRSSEVDIAIGEIAAVSQESSSIAEEVAASSQEQSASTEEIVTASEVLAGMAQELSEHAAKFSL